MPASPVQEKGLDESDHKETKEIILCVIYREAECLAPMEPLMFFAVCN